MYKPRYTGYFCDVPGFALGHAMDYEGMTGVTVIRPLNKATASIDVRGASPGTRETDLLCAEKSVGEVHGIFLAGGSAFGLACADGIMDYLRSQDIGYDTGVTKVPIVPGCVIFDLAIGSPLAYPNGNMGAEAIRTATTSDRSMGNIGAGTGATVGKVNGMVSAMKSGLGQASLQYGDVIVSCVIAVNAFGDVYDPFCQNEILAGPVDISNKKIKTTIDVFKDMEREASKVGGQLMNTTIGCIATNAHLNKSECLRISQMAHDGMARAINPVHTNLDGDALFTISSGDKEIDMNILGALAAEVVAKAIVNAVVTSEGIKGLYCYHDLQVAPAF